MSEARKDGGPAFPSVLYSHERAENWSTDGMSLRDWFAGQALAGTVVVCQHDSLGDTSYPEHCARNAYAMADAMLSERSKAGLPQ